MNNNKTKAARLCQAATLLTLAMGAMPGAVAAASPRAAPASAVDTSPTIALQEAMGVSPARKKTRHARAARPRASVAPMSTPAYQAADRAYKAYDNKDYASAIANAESATRLAPRNAAYWQLLAASQMAAGLLDDADRTLVSGVAATGDEAAFAAPRDNLRRAQALAAGSVMYAAQRQGNAAAATVAAREAVRLAPRHPAYRIALVNLLLQQGQWAEADRAAADAIEILPASAAPFVLRAHARQQLGRWPEAAADYDRAMQLSAPDPAAQRAVRLIAADAALAAREPQRALDRLQGLSANDAEAAPRRTAAAQMLARPQAGQVSSAALALPGIDCGDVEKSLTCALLPPAPPQPAGYEAASKAYAAMNAKDYATAASRAGEAAAASPGNRDYQLLLMNALAADHRPGEAAQAATSALALDKPDATLLLRRAALRRESGDEAGARDDLEAALRMGTLTAAQQAGALADLGRTREARERLAQARAAGELKGTPALEQAYLATRTGDDGAAAAAFAEADAGGKLPVTSLQDAAYASVRARHDDEAVAYFKRTIDAADGLSLKMEPQLRYDTRRAISDVSRKWGLLASLTYRNAGGAVPGFGIGGGGVGNKTLQAGAEVYWRPFGYRDGQYIELFARAFESLYSQSGGATGTDSLQAAVGIRWKPLSEQNAVLSLSRVFAHNGNGNDDWLAQAAYSSDWGSDLRVDVPNWWTTRFSAEVGRYIQHPQTYGLASVMVGRSYRINDPDGRTVVFPHAMAAAEYNSTYAQRSSVGAGPGVSVRHWFREDKYDAPRSYVDFTLQYRALISGDNRTKGLFLSSLVSY